MLHLNKKQNKNTNPVISRQDYHLTQPCPTEENQASKQKLSTNFTLYEAYIYMKLTQSTGPTIGGKKPKGKKNSILKPGKRRLKTQ